MIQAFQLDQPRIVHRETDYRTHAESLIEKPHRVVSFFLNDNDQNDCTRSFVRVFLLHEFILSS